MLRTTLTAALLGLAAPAPALALSLSSTQQAVTAILQDSADAKAGEKATAWPEPRDVAAVKKSVAKIRSAQSDEMEAAGRSEIEQEGAAAAPVLLRAIARESKSDAIQRMRSALDLVTTKEHTRLLAESLDDRSPELRMCVLRRLAVLGDPGLKDRAEAFFQDVKEKAADAKKAKKLHEDEVDRAAIFTLATGSTASLDHCLDLAGSKVWPAWRETLREAAGRAKEAGSTVAEGLQAALSPSANPDISRRVAALRLIAYAGTEAQARSVLPSLDDTANHVKVAAVNALRMMVDGDEPLDKLSTFDAIERANKWKARL
ncbi:hypothetical protein Poly30_11610 [Planctomycetes bacterium Poly30]|uniref:HEAT repeat protein n=1 Tax=Saltatorellus ferox TaxID=2528018 RepID=A0A518ENJ6_9BACT|nr:hypothetical protein Poly30_11610 [Planctomycetes bacterium Poly30]